MSGYVDFLIQNVGLGLVVSNLYGDIDREIPFLCPLRYLSEASVHFNVGRSSTMLC